MPDVAHLTRTILQQLLISSRSDNGREGWLIVPLVLNGATRYIHESRHVEVIVDGDCISQRVQCTCTKAKVGTLFPDRPVGDSRD